MFDWEARAKQLEAALAAEKARADGLDAELAQEKKFSAYYDGRHQACMLERDAFRKRADGLTAENALARDLNEALRQREAELKARAEKAEAERKYLSERERNFLDAIGPVADGGQYRNDIVARIERICSDRDAALAAVDALKAKLAAADKDRRELVLTLKHCHASHARQKHPPYDCVPACPACERYRLLEKHGATVRAEWCDTKEGE